MIGSLVTLPERKARLIVTSGDSLIEMREFENVDLARHFLLRAGWIPHPNATVIGGTQADLIETWTQFEKPSSFMMGEDYLALPYSFEGVAKKSAHRGKKNVQVKKLPGYSVQLMCFSMYWLSTHIERWGFGYTYESDSGHTYASDAEASLCIFGTFVGDFVKVPSVGIWGTEEEARARGVELIERLEEHYGPEFFWASVRARILLNEHRAEAWARRLEDAAKPAP